MSISPLLPPSKYLWFIPDFAPWWFIIDHIRPLARVMEERNIPNLHEHLRRFLHDQLNEDLEMGADMPLEDCPELPVDTRISVFHAAVATFYAPSEQAGPGGMHRELIRCSPRWYGDRARYDTILVKTDDEAPGMLGMTVGRVRMFLSFVFDYIQYRCAFVEWF